MGYGIQVLQCSGTEKMTVPPEDQTDPVLCVWGRNFETHRLRIIARCGWLPSPTRTRKPPQKHLFPDLWCGPTNCTVPAHSETDGMLSGAIGKVASLGFEPRRTESKSGVLPLHYEAFPKPYGLAAGGNYAASDGFGNREIQSIKSFRKHCPIPTGRQSGSNRILVVGLWYSWKRRD